MRMLPYFDPTHWLDLGLIFRFEPEGLWNRVLHVNCSCISELDVGFKSNLYNRSYGSFPGTAIVGLFICCVWIFRLILMQILS